MNGLCLCFIEHIEHYIKTLGPGRSKHIVANAKNFEMGLNKTMD